MDAADRTRDFAHEDIALQPRASDNATPQPSPAANYRNNARLRPDQQQQQQVRPILRQQTSRPSIRISRVPSAQNAPRPQPQPESSAVGANDTMANSGRRRSSSEPQRMSWPVRNDDALSRAATRASRMEPVEEESSRAAAARPPTLTPAPTQQLPSGLTVPSVDAPGPAPGMLRRASAAFGSAIGLSGKRGSVPNDNDRPPGIDPSKEYESQLVDLLDVVGM